MALRTLVTGSDMCTGSDGAGPSNAVGALVNQLLGGASKTQEQLRDVRFLLLMLTMCMCKTMQQLTGHQNTLYCFLAVTSPAWARATTTCSNAAQTRGSCSSSGRRCDYAWHGPSLSISECHKHCSRTCGSSSTPPTCSGVMAVTAAPSSALGMVLQQIFKLQLQLNTLGFVLTYCVQ